MANIATMADNTNNKTALLVIGDEILVGRTQDVNVQFLALELAALGLPLAEVRVVPDQQDEIVAAINALRQKYKYLFTTGGIGPTHDDITADSVGMALQVPVEENAEALQRLEKHYEKFADGVNAARRRMARMPVGAKLIDNPVSAAPGFVIENVYVMAGVPKIMQAMFMGIKPALQGGPPLLSKTVRSHLFEGDLATALAAVAANNPDVALGSYPSMRDGKPLVALVARGFEAARLDAVIAELVTMLQNLGDTPEF